MEFTKTETRINFPSLVRRDCFSVVILILHNQAAGALGMKCFVASCAVFSDNSGRQEEMWTSSRVKSPTFSKMSKEKEELRNGAPNSSSPLFWIQAYNGISYLAPFGEFRRDYGF